MTSLLGYGSHGRDIAAIWDRRERSIQKNHPYHYEPLHVYDDASPGVCRPPQQSTDGWMFGSNFPIQRKMMSERFYQGALPLVDPTADVDLNRMGLGCVIAPRVLGLTDVRMGDHVHINYGSMITRTKIGSFTTIAPGVTICGDVEIGEGVFIGAGAVITNLVKIGDWAIIGAGAVVIRDVRPETTVVGVPAMQRQQTPLDEGFWVP